MEYVIVDIETTGGSPKASKITEIAIYKHDGIAIIDEFSSLINPETKIPEFIVRLTGISDKMVATAPKFFEVAKKIIEFTEGCIFVAHNVGFDYGILRHEFKSLGYDFRRAHLCTVRASRYVLPGKESYSLGKLSRNLGIEIVGRHRAGGDALATAHLFTMLLHKDPGHLQSFIQQDINPKILHPKLDLEHLESIPIKTGIYKFYNEFNQLIYIGKSKQIKKRVDQHLRNTKTKKASLMLNALTRIDYELTGSELIALLKESQLIKKYQPTYNHSLKRIQFPYGIFDHFNSAGYHELYIEQSSKKTETPILSFATKKEAMKYLEQVCDKYMLCQKYCHLDTSNSSCFNYTIKKCKGACIHEETTKDYNTKVENFIQSNILSPNCFFIVDKGRHRGEKSLVLVEHGSIVGFGYAPFHFQGLPPIKWKKFIDWTAEDKDAKNILTQYLIKNKSTDLVHF